MLSINAVWWHFVILFLQHNGQLSFLELETIPAFYIQCPANCSSLTDPTTNNGGAVDVENNALVLQDGFYIAFEQVYRRPPSFEPAWFENVWLNHTDYLPAVNAFGAIRLSTSGMYLCSLSKTRETYIS